MLARVPLLKLQWAIVGDVRSGDDDLGVNHLLLENAVRALLVGGGHKSVALVLQPLADTELVLGGTKELRLHLGVLIALWSY